MSEAEQQDMNYGIANWDAQDVPEEDAEPEDAAIEHLVETPIPDQRGE